MIMENQHYYILQEWYKVQGVSSLCCLWFVLALTEPCFRYFMHMSHQSPPLWPQSDTFFIPHVSCSIPSTFSKSNMFTSSEYSHSKISAEVISFPQDLAHYGPGTVDLCSCDCRKQGLDFGYHCIWCCPLKVLLDDYSSFRWHCNIIVWCVHFWR